MEPLRSRYMDDPKEELPTSSEVMNLGVKPVSFPQRLRQTLLNNRVGRFIAGALVIGGGAAWLNHEATKDQPEPTVAAADAPTPTSTPEKSDPVVGSKQAVNNLRDDFGARMGLPLAVGGNAKLGGEALPTATPTATPTPRPEAPTATPTRTETAKTAFEKYLEDKAITDHVPFTTASGKTFEARVRKSAKANRIGDFDNTQLDNLKRVFADDSTLYGFNNYEIIILSPEDQRPEGIVNWGPLGVNTGSGFEEIATVGSLGKTDNGDLLYVITPNDKYSTYKNNADVMFTGTVLRNSGSGGKYNSSSYGPKNAQMKTDLSNNKAIQAN